MVTIIEGDRIKVLPAYGLIREDWRAKVGANACPSETKPGTFIRVQFIG